MDGSPVTKECGIKKVGFWFFTSNKKVFIEDNPDPVWDDNRPCTFFLLKMGKASCTYVSSCILAFLAMVFVLIAVFTSIGLIEFNNTEGTVSPADDNENRKVIDKILEIPNQSAYSAGCVFLLFCVYLLVLGFVVYHLTSNALFSLHTIWRLTSVMQSSCFSFHQLTTALLLYISFFTHPHSCSSS